MVIARTIECPICNKKYLLRQQVDYTNKFEIPIRFSCKCGFLFKGHFSAENNEHGGIAYFEESTSEAYQEGTDSSIALSSDLPIAKNLLYNPEIRGFFSPFFGANSTFGDISMGLHVRGFMSLLDFLHSNTEAYHHIISIYKQGNISALNSIINKSFPGYLQDEIIDINQARTAILNLLIKPFSLIISPNYNKQFPSKIKAEITDSMPALKSHFNLLEVELNKYYDIDDEFIRGFELLLNFLDRSKHFVPIFLLSYSDDFTVEYGNDYGAVTVTYDEIKNLYSENFEFLSRLSSLLFGLINLKERGDFNTFDIAIGLSDINQYMALDNGKKKEKIELHPFLNAYYLKTVDNQVRNGIGHLKTTYDPIQQIVTYYPFKGNKTHVSKTIHLIDLCFIIYQQTLKVLDSLIVLNHFKKLQ